MTSQPNNFETFDTQASLPVDTAAARPELYLVPDVAVDHRRVCADAVLALRKQRIAEQQAMHSGGPKAAIRYWAEFTSISWQTPAN